MKSRSADSPPGSVPTRNLASTSSPPKLPGLDYTEFRRRLAGLQDPDRHPGAAEKEAVKLTAIRLCSILARLFSDDLDRKTLWSRIGTAFETACAKVSDDDLDRLVDLCLEHVGADFGAAAACDALTQERQHWARRTPEWRHALIC